MMFEKELYSVEFSSVAQRFNADIFVWGEELIDKKLIVYSKNLKDVCGYYEMKEQLQPCGIVLIDTAKQAFLRCISATVHIGTGNVYLSADGFNSAWKTLRNSVARGIRIAKEKGLDAISEPEDIVSLDNLYRQGSLPVIEKFVIKYVPRKLTEEEKYRNSRKQSLLDNPKMLYFYSEDGKYYHDRDCDRVKDILPERFCASSDIPDKEICPKCRRKIYFRKACFPNVKQIPICDKIFREQNVSIGKIHYLIMDLGMKFHATTLDEIFVENKEDKWIIKGLRRNKPELWHNNYVKTSPTERYITDGYHNQKVEVHTFVQMLNCIEQYSFAKHLENENAEKRVLEKEVILVPVDRTETLDEKSRKQNRVKWYIKLWDYLRRGWKSRGV